MIPRSRALGFKRVFIVVAILALIQLTTGRAAHVGASPERATSAVTATSPSVAARFYGSMGGQRLNRPIVGMAATPTGKGYWLVASDGGIFSFGDARFSGSTGGVQLNRPIVGMAATQSGNGYWLVASDGGIFSFGNAHFYGSTGDLRLNRPIVGMAATPTGKGYWLVASDGGIFSFGDARFLGSMGGRQLDRPVVGMAAMPTSQGYWLTTASGKVYAFAAAHYYGGLSDRVRYLWCDPDDDHPIVHEAYASTSSVRIVGITPTRTGGGYWLAESGGNGSVVIAVTPGYPYSSGTPGQPIDPSYCLHSGIVVAAVSFGDAAVQYPYLPFSPPLRNIVGYATTPRASGRWVVASDGGVFVPKCFPGPTCTV